ncbi:MULTISPECIES: hypothetical protein [Streptomyces]|uniref:Uncharacterized protein n=1 Tax=Streptomyces mutomycini TaxID=284036 RepID=A0ABW0B4P7_9ACTN|nr:MULTISPECIES: hypothetical protein [Streptomyces]
MIDTPARTSQRHSDGPSATVTADTGTVAPRPTPQYANLFIEPDLPPFTDDAE